MYVLPFGQMSLWGLPQLALNTCFSFYNFINIDKECLDILLIDSQKYLIFSNIITFLNSNNNNNTSKLIRIPANLRIGPHNKNILSIIFGSLLGHGYVELRSKGTRICFYQEDSHLSYLLWLHKLIADLGYCNPNIPKINTRLGKKGVVRKVIRFKTWTYSSFNWIHNIWYTNNIKHVPLNINEYLTPLALAIWIMDDGSKLGYGLKLCTNSFSYLDCILLVKTLYLKFNIKASIQSAEVNNQFIIYIWKESMPLLCEIVLPYVHSSMKYKLNK